MRTMIEHRRGGTNAEGNIAGGRRHEACGDETVFASAFVPPLRCNFSRSKAAFTLFEAVLATAIFLAFAGAIFLSVSVAARAAAELGEEQVMARRIDAFIRFCRAGFANLPPNATMELRTRDTGRSGRVLEVVMRGAPGAFSAGQTDALGPNLVFSALPDGRGRATLSITRYPGRLSGRDLEHYLEDAPWLPLLEDVEKARWLFWDDANGEFVELWDEGRGLPRLIELQLTLARYGEVSATFRIPAFASANEPPPDE